MEGLQNSENELQKASGASWAEKVPKPATFDEDIDTSWRGCKTAIDVISAISGYNSSAALPFARLGHDYPDVTAGCSHVKLLFMLF